VVPGPIFIGRNAERGPALVAEIEEEGKGSARFYAADLGSFEEVRALAEGLTGVG
jgi:hypothetical protein